MADPKHQAFLRAYQSCHDPFLRYCTALAYGQMDTEDLVQDVLLTAYVHFDKIKNQHQLLHYLIRGAKNRSVSNWRKKKYQAALEEKHTLRLEAREVSPETILEIQHLYRALHQLPEKQRDALMLFEISGFSMKEIAEIQDATEGAVKTKISRGRQKLKALLRGNTQSVASILRTLKTIAL